jgi:hypothetical protein
VSLSYPKKDKRGRMSIAGRFIVVLLSILFLAISAEAEFLAQKSDSKKSFSGSDRKKKNDDETMADFEFLRLVTAFADNYAFRLTQSSVTLKKGLKNNTDRLAAFNIIINAIHAAYEINMSSNSFIAIMDMTATVNATRLINRLTETIRRI